MKINCLLGLVAILLAGCATQRPSVTTYIDPVTRARTDLMSENMLETPEPIREIVWLNASRMFRTARNYQYYLEVDYMARRETGFLEIPPGETLVIVADGQELKFTGSGSLNNRKELKEEVTERAIYPASGEQLRTIAIAEKVEVSIRGRSGMVQRTFTPENTQRFRQFVGKYVTG
ncbi:MAG: hypothetical protein AB9869_17455 [Verrucomicrobiia bacterium]